MSRVISYEQEEQRQRRAALRRRRRRQQIMRRLVVAAAAVLVAAAAGMVLWNGGSAAEAVQPPAARPDPGATLPAENTGGIVVAIDPGHGGLNEAAGSWDHGTEGNGCVEADLTHRIARGLQARLERDGRFAPVMTADGTVYLKGSERGAVAQEAGAELLVSIHFNSDPSYGSRGLECYPATPGMETNADSLRFAKLVVEGFSEIGLPLRGEQGIRYLYFDENDRRCVYEASDTTPRPYPTFTVLEACECPAVLVEQGFLTDASDAALLGTDEGCQNAAGIYYRAICRYFGLDPQ